MTESNGIADLQRNLERVASLLRQELREALSPIGLQPVQFEVLDYIAHCNRYSDTPMAVTEYLGQTKGSVSQTLIVLQKNGLIAKSIDTADRRVVHLSLTTKGRRLLSKVFPSHLLEKSLPASLDSEMSALNSSLVELIRALQVQNNRRSFGQCFSCEHHLKLGKNKFRCGLTGEPLSLRETELICREHSAAA